jgi:protein subunit release factor A
LSYEHNLQRVATRYLELRDTLSGMVDDPEKFQRLSREFSELTPIAEAIEELRLRQSEAGDLAELIADPGTDGEMRVMAEEEFAVLKDRLPALAATRRRCSPASCSRCISAMPRRKAGSSRLWKSRIPISAAFAMRPPR